MVSGKSLKLEDGEWRLISLFFADDAALLHESEEQLQKFASEFDNVCRN